VFSSHDFQIGFDMLTAGPDKRCDVEPTQKASLMVVVDTEEEFDWTQPKTSSNTSVQSLRWISRVDDIFDEYCITPLYVVDYPIVSQPEGFQPLLNVYNSARCLIGAHLHPWVNPPFEEVVSAYNSFPGNLGYALEHAKLRILTDAIAERFGARPVIYKAGRYGIGPHTTRILEELGYEIDMSVCPYMDYSAEGGPNFSASTAWPYWFGRGLLELPLTIGFAGSLRRYGHTVHPLAVSMSKFHLPGLLARLGIVNKVWLSPEGYNLKEMIALARALYRDGLRTFVFSFHSPSLDSGHTPYVRSQRQLCEFLDRIRGFFYFFMGEFGGVPTTPLEIKSQLAGINSKVKGCAR
jgi:hypothetical protein